jgi:pimeloyl-ACP methyl ester carboxylesterase
VWGTGDIFFPVKWSHWLVKTIPGAKKRLELDRARILFPEERSYEFKDELRRFWESLS